ncbi:MAG TPA: hypothetical protein VLT59_12460 [Steroidobacteraceae bacterium]|nr:hypothetical protein [Steroidobacteraceae bacterium]
MDTRRPPVIEGHGGYQGMNNPTRLLVVLVLCACAMPASRATELIAIDVLLEPGPTMLEQAADWNARMREQAPQGFALDADHRPHITLLQRHIAIDDLDEVLAAVDRVRQEFDVALLRLFAGLRRDVRRDAYRVCAVAPRRRERSEARD